MPNTEMKESEMESEKEVINGTNPELTDTEEKKADKKEKLFIIAMLIAIALFAVFMMVKGIINSTPKTNVEPTSVRVEEGTIEQDNTADVKTDIEPFSIGGEEEDNPYLSYIPVYFNGEEKNLYDLFTEDEVVVYLQRPTCDDCTEYGPRILELLEDSGVLYIVIETNPEPWTISGLSMEGAMATAIGIESVPSLIFVKEGKAVAKFDGEIEDEEEMAEEIKGKFLNTFGIQIIEKEN